MINVFSLLGACLVACCSSVNSNNFHLDHKRNGVVVNGNEYSITYNFDSDSVFTNFIDNCYNATSSQKAAYIGFHYYNGESGYYGDNAYGSGLVNTLSNQYFDICSALDFVINISYMSFGVLDYMYYAGSNDTVYSYRLYLMGDKFDDTSFLFGITDNFVMKYSDGTANFGFYYYSYADQVAITDGEITTLPVVNLSSYRFLNVWNDMYYSLVFHDLQSVKCVPVGNIYLHSHLSFANYLLPNQPYLNNNVVKFTIDTNDYDTGFNDGYDVGQQAGEIKGYDDGYDVGYDEGQEAGYTSGYSTGHAVGYNDGLNVSDYQFVDLFGAIADTPVLMIRSLFDFDFFGINLLTVVLSLFTGLIVFYLLRKLL